MHFILHSLHNTWYKTVALHCHPQLKPSPKTSQFDFEYIILTCLKVSQRYTVYILILAYIVILTTYECFLQIFPFFQGTVLRTYHRIMSISTSAMFVVYNDWATRNVSPDSLKRSVVTSCELIMYSLIKDITVDLLCPFNKEQF